jgi:hypothetical protein
MHATHLEGPTRLFPTMVLMTALALAFGPALVSAEEPAKAPSATSPAPTTPEAGNKELPSPAPAAPSAQERQSKPAPYGLIFRQPDSASSRSNLVGPDSASFDIARSLPLINRMPDVNIFSGLYEFAEDTPGNMAGLHAGTDLALTDRVQLEAAFNQDPDMNRRNGFVGLWASIPLREGASNRTTQSGDSPHRTLIASIGGEPTRHRTSRRVDGAGGRQGFFSRIFGGMGDRDDRAPTPTIPAPLQATTPAPVTASTADSTASAGSSTAPEKTSRGWAADFLQRIRR